MHEQKLLPAEAAGQVARADVARDEGAHAAQHGVAGVVAVGVVKALEVVDVEHHHAQGFPAALGAVQLEL